MSSSTGADLQSSRAECNRLNGRIAALEQELATSKADCEQASRLIEALKKQVEELRKEMKDIARDAAAKLEVYLICTRVSCRRDNHALRYRVSFVLYIQRELAALELTGARKASAVVDELKLRLQQEKEDALTQLKQVDCCSSVSALCLVVLTLDAMPRAALRRAVTE